MAMAMVIAVSTHFVWNPLPKMICSRFPMAVSRKTKRMDPKNPPKIVMACVEASIGLAICMPLKVRMAKIEATGNDVPSVNAILSFKNYNSELLTFSLFCRQQRVKPSQSTRYFQLQS